MLYGNYEFVCRFEDEAHLPPFKGATVRGLLGHALRRVVCALKRQACETCLLRDDCLFARMFVLPPPSNNAASNTSVEPHPFVLEPPLEKKTVYQPGETITIGLILFGELNRKLPYFVYAFDEMGRIGIGRRNDGRRGCFALEQVLSGGQSVYDPAQGRIQLPSLERLSLHGGFPPPAGTDLLEVDLKTPLRFKRNGRLHDDMPFEELVRLALRRAASLLAAFGSGEPDLDYSGIVQRAAAVTTVANDLAWADWERYSSRQKRRMQLGGIVGRVSYAGELDEFLNLLAFAARTHLGKNSSFGLGAIKLTPMPGHESRQLGKNGNE